MTINRDDVPDDEFVPFVVRPEIRECSVCGYNLDGEVAGLWGKLGLKTCSNYHCHRVAITFLALHARAEAAEARIAAFLALCDTWDSPEADQGRRALTGETE